MNSFAVGPLTTPIASEGECQVGWKKRGSFCYFFEMEKSASWINAHYECRRKHTSASLTTVEDIVESKWILGMTSEIKAENIRSYGSFQPWIGLYRSRIGKVVSHIHFIFYV